MSLKVALIIDGDSGRAQAAIRAAQKAMDDAGKSGQKLSAAGKKAAGSTRDLAGAADLGEDEIRKLQAAEMNAARAALDMGQSNRIAAGQVGNLAAQYNDIFVMMAAGQNPFQLAIQQGTQITQVIGPMGATGAVRALSQALVSMVNPVSLVTIGSIAAGAAMIQWLTDAGDEVETLEDAISGASDAIEAFEAAAERARLSTAGMAAEFGTASPELRAVLEDIAALGKIDAYQAIDRTAASLKVLVGELASWDARSEQSQALDFLGLSGLDRNARRAASEFAYVLDLLASAEEPALKLQAALDLRSRLLDAAGGIERLNAGQREFYDGLTATIRDLILLGAKVEEQAQSGLHAREAAQQAYYASMRQVSDADLAAARDRLASLTAENEIRQAIVQHGRDSAEAAELEAARAREANEEWLATLEVSESLKDELRAAFEEGLQLANLDMASGVSAAANEAARLAEWLGISVSRAMQLAATTPDMADEDTVMSQSVLPDARQREQNRRAVENFQRLTNPRSGRSGGGGGGGGRGSTSAIESLIARETQRLEILRATDPVQKEILRNSRLLAEATGAERAAVEQLIATRVGEEEQMRALRDQQEFFSDSLYDSLEGLIVRGEDLSDVLANVAEMLARAALQATLLGTGPLAGLFGGGGGGGLLGSLFGAALPRHAKGGMIHGPGDGRSDSVLMLGSSGEFVMNARATARHRHLLEAMNSGSAIPGFAGGGAVDGSSILSTGGAAPRVIEVNVNVSGARGNAEIEQMVFIGTNRALEEYDREILPVRFRQISADGRRIG